MPPAPRSFADPSAAPEGPATSKPPHANEPETKQPRRQDKRKTRVVVRGFIVLSNRRIVTIDRRRRQWRPLNEASKERASFERVVAPLQTDVTATTARYPLGAFINPPTRAACTRDHEPYTCLRTCPWPFRVPAPPERRLAVPSDALDSSRRRRCFPVVGAREVSFREPGPRSIRQDRPASGDRPGVLRRHSRGRLR